MSADVVFDGAVDVSATFVIHVDDSTVIIFQERDPALVARMLDEASDLEDLQRKRRTPYRVVGH